MHKRYGVKRRAVFGAIATLAAPEGALAEPDPGEQLNIALAALTDALAKIHGVPWQATVDHDNRFVLILAGNGRGLPLG